MEPKQEQLPLPPLKRQNPRLQQIPRHIVIQPPLLRAHRVLKQPRLPPYERLLQKRLCLAPQRPLQHDAKPVAQFLLLPLGELTGVFPAEHLAERGEVAEQCAEWIDVLNEAPELDEVVLHRRRG